MEGLEVYEQVHQNEINRIIHLTFLPMLFYGIFRAVPHKILPIIVFAYTGYYSYVINPWAGMLTYITICPWGGLSMMKEPDFKHGMILVTGSLILQEIVGHSLFETINSRITPAFVTNAVMYSPLFYSMYILQYWQIFIMQLLILVSLK